MTPPGGYVGFQWYAPPPVLLRKLAQFEAAVLRATGWRVRRATVLVLLIELFVSDPHTHPALVLYDPGVPLRRKNPSFHLSIQRGTLAAFRATCVEHDINPSRMLIALAAWLCAERSALDLAQASSPDRLRAVLVDRLATAPAR